MSKRRTFTPAFKAQVVLDILTGTKSVAQTCREHSLKDTLVYRWKQEFIARAPQVFDQGGPAQDPHEAQIAELERVVGRLTMELEIAKKASQLWRSPPPRNGS